MIFRQFIHWCYKRFVIHFWSTLCAGAFVTLTIMLYKGIIDATQFGVALGAILSFYMTMSKDPGKTVTKMKFQIPDVETKEAREERKLRERIIKEGKNGTIEDTRE